MSKTVRDASRLLIETADSGLNECVEDFSGLDEYRFDWYTATFGRVTSLCRPKYWLMYFLT